MAKDALSIEDLRALSAAEGGTCVSFYMPMARASKETLSNPTRVKNLMREAQIRVDQAGGGTAMLSPLATLTEDYDYWQHQEDGLAVFLTENVFRTYRLPFHVDEFLVVSDGFHLKPLLPFVVGDDRLFLLALSQHSVVLHTVDCNGIEPIETPFVPSSIEEALRFDDPEKSLQIHTSQRVATGDQAVMTHGQGVHKDVAKDKLLRFFRRVDKGLHPHLKDHTEPLVLAGVDYYLPIYAEANTYPHLVRETIPGNPEHMSAAALHQVARQFMEPMRAEPRRHAAATIEQALADGKAATSLEDVVAAAVHGRVDTCFVALDEQAWGRVDPGTGRIERLRSGAPRARDLLDFAAVRTLLQGGRVFAVPKTEIPGGGAVAAQLRY